VFSQDDSRVGVLTGRRRRLTVRGVQPVGAGQHVLAWVYVDGAVAPTTGERCFLERPDRNAASFPRFIDAFAQAFADSLNSLRLDHSGTHTVQRLTIPANARLVCLPPYGPELNPLARVWRALKDAIAWQQFPKVEGQQDYVGQLWRADDAPR
jgi:DDE superfamily endonuclease